MSDINTQAHPHWQPQELFLACLWNDPPIFQDDLDDNFLSTRRGNGSVMVQHCLLIIIICSSTGATSSASSQEVLVAEEVLIVAELLKVDVLLLQASAVEGVVVLGDLVSVLARSWHFDRA